MNVYDIAIIGGGINGASIAEQAARVGLKVIIFEKGDWASGTSSKSTKLIHGGIRYLERGEIGLVYEALREKRTLLKIAPHLVSHQTFLLPVYKGDARGPWKVKWGLWLYDLLASAPATQNWLSKDKALRRAPFLNPEGLLGAGVYQDAKTNDARLVLENILLAKAQGATLRSYHEVVSIQEKGEVFLVKFRKPLENKSSEVEARVVINAAGPFANEVQSRLLKQEKLPPLVRPTRGTHLILPPLNTSDAYLITSQEDQRVLFAIPWQGQTLLGTTDIDQSAPEKAVPTEEEIETLLKRAGCLFPKAAWKRESVIATFAGLRPLAYTAEGAPSEVSREEKLICNGRFLSIVGGKLSTYRAMGEKVLRQISKLLSFNLRKEPLEALPGTPNQPWEIFIQDKPKKWQELFDIDLGIAKDLATTYGKRGEAVLSLTLLNPEWKKPLVEGYPEILASVAYAVLHEEALHLDDVLLRRLKIGYSRFRKDAAEPAAALMASLLSWPPEQTRSEIHNYLSQLTK